jgi:hypothetical protein
VYYVCLLGSAQRNFNNNNIGKGRLTERLLAQGLLTPNMIDELHREWNKVIIYFYIFVILVEYSRTVYN